MLRIVRSRWLAAAAMAATMSTSVVTAAPARAVSPLVVIAAVRQAVGIYQELAGNQQTVENATAQIIAAIEAAKQEILQQIDGIAAADVRACSRSALIDLADFASMTVDTRQAYARDSSACVAHAEALLAVLDSPPAVDTVGYAVNIVGPIALFARTATGLTGGLEELRQSYVDTNEAVMAKLTPACNGAANWGDVVVHTPGIQYWVEVQVTCTAYDGRQGSDAVTLRLVPRQPAPTSHRAYADAQTQAAGGTSYVVAEAALQALS